MILANALLVLGLVLPVVVFLGLRSRTRWHGGIAAAIAIAIGWAANAGWAAASATGDAEGADMLAIALRFGWACPAVLVAVTWGVMAFRARRRPSSQA